MNRVAERRMKPKQLYNHIFYVNQQLNFNYDFKWHISMRKKPPEFPTEHLSNVPVKTISELRNKFLDKILICVGSGPSLNKNIEQLNEIKDRDDVIILACDGSIWDLKEHGIKPDYVISTEADGQHNRAGIPTTDILLMDKCGRDNEKNRDLFKPKPDEELEFYNDVPLIACTWLNHNFHKIWPCKDRFWFVNYDERKTYKGMWDCHENVFPVIDEAWPKLEARASMVGFFAIELGRYLDVKEIILLGYDMQATQAIHHSKGFNVVWTGSNTNLKDSYNDHFMWFLSHFYGLFDFDVTNCTEGGVLTEAATDAKWLTLAEKIKQIKEQ